MASPAVFVSSVDAAYEQIRVGLKHLLLLLVRLYWGYQFALTGWGKLNNLERVGAWFGSLGVPFPEANAFLVGSIELVGGIVLLVGFGRGYFSIPLVGIMAVAYLTDDWEALSNIFSDPESFIAALPFTYMLANLLVIAFGPGVLSLDSLIEYLRKRRTNSVSDGTLAEA